MMPVRFAIYYLPPAGSAWEAFGESWLGRDARGREVARPVIDGLAAEELARLTASPRGYGFHATLKPPFQLAAGTTAAELGEAVTRFAASVTAFTSPTLTLGTIGRFLALVPTEASAELDRLARDTVTALDYFRAPPAEAERERRRARGLNPRQERLLDQWGYPYVFEEYRFHMTLTGPIDDPARRERVSAVLGPLIAPFAAVPLPVAEIGLFRQDGPGIPFVLHARLPFGGRL